VNEINIEENQVCPNCDKETLTTTETKREIPYFGEASLYSLRCHNEYCDFFQADVEALSDKGPLTVTYTITKEDDVNTRVVKSSDATVHIGNIGSIEPGSSSAGYITTVEGVLNRMLSQIQYQEKTSDSQEDIDLARRYIDELEAVLQGEKELTLEIDDPKGNSMIISEDADVSELKQRE